MSEQLFVYGTLTNPLVQREIIGREVTGKPDVLAEFDKKNILIDGKYYPMIFPSEGRFIEGIVIEIKKEELSQVDAYEGKDYKRDRINLMSGRVVWVYQQASK